MALRTISAPKHWTMWTIMRKVTSKRALLSSEFLTDSPWLSWLTWLNLTRVLMKDFSLLLSLVAREWCLNLTTSFATNRFAASLFKHAKGWNFQSGIPEYEFQKGSNMAPNSNVTHRVAEAAEVTNNRLNDSTATMLHKISSRFSIDSGFLAKDLFCAICHKVKDKTQN